MEGSIENRYLYYILKNPLDLLNMSKGILEDVGKFIFINVITLW